MIDKRSWNAFINLLMDIRTIYEIVTLNGQKSPREYIDTKKKIKKAQVKQPRRKTFVEEIQKLSKMSPGPGKYQPNPEDKKYPPKVYKKLNFKEEVKKPGTSHIDKLLKQKSKIPGVGKYNMQVDNTEQMILRCKIKGDKARKQAPLFKASIFEDNQIDCLKIGPGFYNPDKPFGDKKSYKIQEGDHLAKDTEEDDKKKKPVKSQSLPKIPGSQSYSPIPQNFDTFDRMASQSGNYSVSNNFTKGKRSQSVHNLGPGPKYSLISQWSPKKDSKRKNFFKSVSTLRHPGVYN